MTAKQLLSVEDHGGENKLRLHEEVVNSLLLSDDVADKPVVVISVAGAFRTGKSFLLNSMSRYLMASDKSHWLDNKTESFSWQSGCERHTNGIFMTHPIPVTLQSGEEAVLLLMDSQGIFDDNSTTNDSTRIFALSTLLSSVQVYNVRNNLQNDDLDNLQLFTEYGRMAMDNTEGKPFQDLLFLIRDWYHTQNHPFGSQGGNDLVEKRLSSNKESLTKGREHIKACFRDVSGFLLPHPGEVVAGSPTFAGDEKDMHPAFSRALEELVSTLLSPEKLSVKMNGNRPMTCRQLVIHIKTYIDLFQSDELPEAKSILQAVAEASNMAAVNDEHLTYTKQLEGLLGQDAPMLDEILLYEEHEQAKTEALKSLNLRRTMRDPTREENYYHGLLVDKIEDWFKAEHNKKLGRDISEAKNANHMLVDKCIKLVQKRTERGPLDPRRFVPRSEATIRDEHEEAKQEALELFNARKVTVGSYDAEDSRLRLEQALGGDLRVALEKNDTVKAAHKMILDRDISEAKKANQTLVDECIELVQNCMERHPLDIWSYLPMKEATVRDIHEEANQTALKLFNAGKVTVDSYDGVDSYDAEESRWKIVLATDEHLREALKKNGLQLHWWVSGAGAPVGAAVAGGAAFAGSTVATGGATVLVAVAGAVVGATVCAVSIPIIKLFSPLLGKLTDMTQKRAN